MVKVGASTLPHTVAYRNPDSQSRRLYDRACRVMPGGNTRHSIALDPYPVYAARGAGCRVTDVEGDERIDFVNNFTSLILGHAHAALTEAVTLQMNRGTAVTMPTQLDVELAELIVDRVPYIDQVRFCNSGSEAVMLGVKAARAFTGRSKIAKFEGAYHGIYDYVQVSEGPTHDRWGDAATPRSIVESGSVLSIADEVLVLPWNDFVSCQRLLAQHGSNLAAIIVDPLPAGIGLIPPKPGFLEALREETLKQEILWLSDEVLTFRLSYRGMLAELGIDADLTSLGKIIGGGFPVGAIGGSASVMSVFDHSRGPAFVHHGGTFNGNPVTMAAGLATMRQMTETAYGDLAQLGDELRERLCRMFSDNGITATVCGRGSLFAAHLGDVDLVNFRSLRGYSRTSPAYGALCHEMLGRGILATPRGIFGCLSTPMTIREVESYVEALRQSLQALDH